MNTVDLGVAGTAPGPVKPPATWEPCERCNGDGDWLPTGACGACEHCPNPVKCSACNGTGRTPATATAEPVKPPETELCRQCSGAKVIGWGAGQPCFACNGTGAKPRDGRSV